MTPDDGQSPAPRKRYRWWPWAGAVLVSLLALALIVTMRDASHEARCGPLLAARTEASVEAGRPFWQQQPETFEEVLAAAEAMLEMDDRSLPFGRQETFEAILAVEVEQGCVDEDDQDEVLRQWRRSALPSFDPRNVDMWDLDSDGSLSADEIEIMREWWEADRQWSESLP